MSEKIKGYKGFNKDMTCKGKQYEENTTYEENGNGICSAGVMHFCKNPWDVLNYYPIVNENGERIKGDKFYKLVDGEFMEVYGWKTGY